MEDSSAFSESEKELLQNKVDELEIWTPFEISKSDMNLTDFGDDFFTNLMNLKKFKKQEIFSYQGQEASMEGLLRTQILDILDDQPKTLWNSSKIGNSLLEFLILKFLTIFLKFSSHSTELPGNFW